MVNFSNKNREQFVNQLKTIHFDILVIGGGITGAGIALDATTRGMKVALIDMQDFAAGTSSRSTKLVHGGLRYLKQFEWKLVREVGKERAIVFRNGPHVTRPVKMLLPIYNDGTFGKTTTSLGLKLYDFLASVAKQERRKMLDVTETIQSEPLLKREGLKGAGLYVEYRTDDARLTLEVMKKAYEHGAIALNYAKVESFLYRNGKMIGAKVIDCISGMGFEIHAQFVINSTGPWVDEVRCYDKMELKEGLKLTKGVHIVVDHARLPITQAVYFDTPDRRMVFAIPRENKTYIGTTDSFCDHPVATPCITIADCRYLLEAIDYVFPNTKISLNDIESSWAGIRPLIFQEGKGPSEISRKDEIWQSDSGLISIAGGKLTGYRKMAETVVDLLVKKIDTKLNKRMKPCQTKHLPISGGEELTPKIFYDFVERKSRQLSQYGISSAEAKRLVCCYGSNINKILKNLEHYQQTSKDHQLPLTILARLDYAINEEMALTPVDFFFRRTGMLLFNIGEVLKWKEAVLSYMATVLFWNEDQYNKYETELNQVINTSTVISE
ncbi:glycerol-3-phosphate dehydrogenase/oxidase [Bacillus marasmi]|uniref:glycerol-3-phosphate dehydrogenase/oxidase n=1 Tax=Bacillus marasmi TaxID=1926279 RepID=UPI0011C802A9|nr:glycerol-3-phosphate dehydrogenase/oxidase [Bacillus marasmi]